MFEATEGFQLGPANVPISLIAVVMGLAIFLLWIKKGEREQSHQADRFRDLLFSSLFVALLVYKFWPFVENYGQLSVKPSQLLLYSGGAYGWEAAMISGVLWFTYGGIRRKLSLWLTVEWLLLGFVSVRVASSLLLKKVGMPTDWWGWTVQGQVYVPMNLLEGVGYLLLVGVYAWVRGQHGVKSGEDHSHHMTDGIITTNAVDASQFHKERAALLLVGVGLLTLLLTLGETGRNAVIWGNWTLAELCGFVAIIIGGLLLLYPIRYKKVDN
ncbi:hypothetical protein [Brevibacillus dissolubilis]|uniref:hypothetical protein n=1 Tax=Brevibacillus dissolubilis TaxID=1844116 RepID=UPI00111757B4|nr:hypothetical protein [Brevibacillus dissolubilis]